MASRKKSSEVIDFTIYINKNKNINKKEYIYYSKKLILLLLDDNHDKKEIYSLFSVFLAPFTSSISFSSNNNKKDIFQTIGLFSAFVTSDYSDFSLLIKAITSFLA